MLKSINKYIKNNEFSINILDNLININNYIDIIVLESNKIVLDTPLGYLRIFGDNLTIKKILDNELLINGLLYSLEINRNV